MDVVLPHHEDTGMMALSLFDQVVQYPEIIVILRHADLAIRYGARQVDGVRRSRQAGITGNLDVMPCLRTRDDAERQVDAVLRALEAESAKALKPESVQLTAVEKALVVMTRDASLSLRKVAKQVGCSVSLLSRD